MVVPATEIRTKDKILKKNEDVSIPVDILIFCIYFDIIV